MTKGLIELCEKPSCEINSYVSACLEKLKGIITKNLNLNDINDSKKFWTTVKLVFCNKIRSAESIALHENGKLVRDEKEVANIFNDFFCKYSAKFRDKYPT